ncbi:MAG: hypothetical protein IJ785_03510 [Bacteroidales bacterium]|nr:hypothetical protein [Bacteroidales bacterium]
MNYYRIFLLLVLGLLFAEGGRAQSISFDPLPTVKGITKKGIPQFIGSDSLGTVLVQYGGRLKNRMELVCYDGEMKEQATVPLQNTGDVSCYGGYINGPHIDLLQVAISDTALSVYRDRRDRTSLNPVGGPAMLAHYPGQKGDEFAFGMGVSADGKLLAGVAVANRGVQGTEVKVGLYDHELKPYWTHNCSEAVFSNVYVTDSGDVVLYTLGRLTTTGRRRGRTVTDDNIARFTIVDGTQELHVEFALPESDLIMDKALLRYGDGNILIAAAVRKENHSVMPIGSNVDAINIYCYNIASQKLTVEQHPFTLYEVNRLTNEKETSKQRHFWVQFGQISQCIADADGAYLMVDQQWRTTLNNVPVAQQRMGMMVMRVDRNGKVKWTTVRRFNGNTSWDQRDYLDHRWMATPTGIMLAWVDHISNIGFPLTKPYKIFTPFKSKGTLNVWTLGPDGKEDISFLEVSRSALAGSTHRLEEPGHYVVLLSSGNKQQLVKIACVNPF